MSGNQLSPEETLSRYATALLLGLAETMREMEIRSRLYPRLLKAKKLTEGDARRQWSGLRIAHEILLSQLKEFYPEHPALIKYSSFPLAPIEIQWVMGGHLATEDTVHQA